MNTYAYDKISTLCNGNGNNLGLVEYLTDPVDEAGEAITDALDLVQEIEQETGVRDELRRQGLLADISAAYSQLSSVADGIQKLLNQVGSIALKFVPPGGIIPPTQCFSAGFNLTGALVGTQVLQGEIKVLQTEVSQ